MADLTQTYGPFYGGMLEREQMNSQSALGQNEAMRRTLGLLADMEQQKLQAEQIRESIAARKAQEQRIVAEESRKTSARDRLGIIAGNMFPPKVGLPREMDAADNVMTPGESVEDPRAGYLRAIGDLDPSGLSDIAKGLLGFGPGGGRFAPSALGKALLDLKAARESGDPQMIAHAEAYVQRVANGFDQVRYGTYQGYGFPEQQRQAEFQDRGVAGLPVPGTMRLPGQPQQAQQPIAPQQAPQQTSTAPQSGGQDWLAGEMAATQFRLTQARATGDEAGIQREQANLETLKQAQSGPAPSSMDQSRPQAALAPRDVREVNKANTLERNKFWNDKYKGINDAALAVPSALAQLSILGQALQSAGSGPLTPTIVQASDVLRQLGVEVESLKRVPGAQASAVVANRMMLTLRSTGENGLVGMPGALSDKDLQFLRESIPNIANNPAANSAMIEILTRVERRKQEIAQLANAYAQKYGNGGLDAGFQDAIRQYAEKNPLFARMKF